MASPPEGAFPLPPLLTHPSSPAGSPTLVTQGAEARLYRTTFLSPSLPAALKYRPKKPYRHPILDARLTRARILAEARVLAKCRREGCPVPALYALDEAAGWLMLEWIPGAPVRVRINEWLDGVVKVAGEDGGRLTEIAEGDGERMRAAKGDSEEVVMEGSEEAARQRETDAGGQGKIVARERDATDLRDLMRRMGAAIGRMHKIGIVHGDLTTSNMMLRPPKPAPDTTTNTDTTTTSAGDAAPSPSPLDGDVFIIDFGLASQSTSDEDRAVDLYVLERAFGSTHPRAETYFRDVLDAYRASYKQAPVTLKKLEDVRMRGRKRSMIG
ncbi:serine threonine-protein kinase bud32 [Colletotrichum incanum]|uniref:EKC/KEOPS complex subunit BUD32 n=1 Tax=Colletotrichum incanum TaxID=1573173 RepID=A0A161VZ15_COLIC|nr:serine threonine-protein kinase bud32 [Colletotrichum incanum]OHW94863.1 serine threonine-protein kinase [Colletotrichum incanum]